MDSDSISLHDEEECSGDFIMSDDDIDPNYEPTDDEILKYAIHLGMDPEQDSKYFYLAKEGLMAPIPKPWKVCQTKTGDIYYANFETEQQQFDHPLDNLFREKFKELKALENKEHNKEKDEKSFGEGQKKHQSSKSVQLVLNNRLDDAFFPSKYSNSQRDFERESPFSELSPRFSKDELPENFEKTPRNSEKQSEAQGSPTLEHSPDPDFCVDEGNTEVQVSSREQYDPLNEANIVQTDSDMPHAGNIYDDMLSANNQSELDGDNFLKDVKDNKTEGDEETEEDGIGNRKANNTRKNDRISNRNKFFGNEKTGTTGGLKGKGGKKINFYDDEYEENKVETEDYFRNRLDSENNLDKSLGNPDGLFNLSQSQIGNEPRSHTDLDDNSKPTRLVDESKAKKEGRDVLADEKTEETQMKKKKRDSNDTNYDELEEEFNSLLSQYEKELKEKLSEILEESKQGYQDKIMKIQRDYTSQIENIRNEYQKSPPKGVLDSLEEEKEKLRKILIEQNEKELQEEFQKVQNSFDVNKKELEHQEDLKLQVALNEFAKAKESEYVSHKQEIENMINEGVKEVQGLYNHVEKINNERELLKNEKMIVLSEFEDLLRQVELRESMKLQKEVEAYKEDSETKIEKEKAELEEAYRNSQEELNLLRVRLEESYSRSLLEEKNKLQKMHEKDLHELETRMERIATQNVMGKTKLEHDKRMNSFQVEKMLHEKQSRKRVEDLQQQFVKKFELEKVSFENQKANEMKTCTSEINSLLNQLLVKENSLMKIKKYGKEIDHIEKEIATKNSLTKQFSLENSELEAQNGEIKLQIDEYQSNLKNLKSKLNMKNNSLKKVNELHQQLDKVEQEIQTAAEKFQSQQRANPMDYSTNETVVSQSSVNKISKLFREVEQIKNAVQKRAVRKSLSVSRIAAKNFYSFYDPTNESKMSSVMNNTDIEAPSIDVSRPILEHLEKEQPSLDVNKSLRKHPEPKKRSSLVNPSQFLLDKRQKEIMQPSSHKSSSFQSGEPAFRPSQGPEKRKTVEVRDEWGEIIEAEKKNIDKYEYILMKKKTEVKEAHKHLKYEADQYKAEYTAYKDLKSPSLMTKEQLENFKKSLNEKINEYNQRLQQIREKESILKLRQQTLGRLESLHYDFLAGKLVNPTKLNEVYTEYTRIGSKHRADPEKSKSFDLNANANSRKMLVQKRAAEPENERMSLNLNEVFQKYKGHDNKNRSIGNADGLKENSQPRLTALDSKEKLFDKVKSSIFQRNSVSKAFPSSTQNIKREYESNKFLKEYSSLGKK